MIALQYHCRRTWREVENNGVGGKELLVTGDDEGSSEVCGGVRSVPKAQKPSRGSGRQANVQLYTRETLEAH